MGTASGSTLECTCTLVVAAADAADSLSARRTDCRGTGSPLAVIGSVPSGAEDEVSAGCGETSDCTPSPFDGFPPFFPLLTSAMTTSNTMPTLTPAPALFVLVLWQRGHWIDTERPFGYQVCPHDPHLFKGLFVTGAALPDTVNGDRVKKRKLVKARNSCRCRDTRSYIQNVHHRPKGESSLAETPVHSAAPHRESLDCTPNRTK